MSDSLLSQDVLLKMSARDVLPANSQIRSQASSVYVRRYEVNRPATNGSEFQPNSEIRFRLSSGGAGCVPSSMAIRMRIRTEDNAANPLTYAFDEHPALSVVGRLRSFVAGGKVVDDISYNNNLTHCLLQVDGGKDWCNGSGGVMLGTWKRNPLYMARGQAQGDGTGLVQEAEDSVFARIQEACREHDAGVDVVLPLSALGCGLCTQQTILPMRGLGLVEFVLNVSSVAKAIAACRTGAPAGAGAPNFVIENPTLTCDFVDFSSDYTRLLDQVFQSPQGLRMPIRTWNVQAQSNAIGVAASSKDFVYSAAYRNVESMLMWKTHNVDDRLPAPAGAIDTNSVQFSLSTQRSAAQSSWRMSISGRLYPNYDAITNSADQYYHNMKALAAMSGYNQSAGCGDVSSFSVVKAPVTEAAAYSGAAPPAPTTYTAENPLVGNYIMLQSFQNARESSNVNIDGADLSIAGSVIRVSVTDDANGSTGTSETMYLATRHVRLLTLANGELSVEF